jgi:hypothetical protein
MVIYVVGATKEAAPVTLTLESIICIMLLSLVMTVTIGIWTYVVWAGIIAPLVYVLDRRYRNTYLQKEIAKALNARALARKEAERK